MGNGLSIMQRNISKQKIFEASLGKDILNNYAKKTTHYQDEKYDKKE